MKKLLTILAVLLLGTINVFSQEQTKTLYDVYLEMGNDAYENGNYESAINWITKASEYAKNNFGESSPNYATSLNNLAVCYERVEEYTKSLDIHIKVADIRKRIFGENHPAYAISLGNMGTCYSYLGNYIMAIKLNKLAAEIRKEALGEMHPDYALSLSNLASCYYNNGDYSKAIEVDKQALNIRKTILGERHIDYASSLNNLATCHNVIGETIIAIELHKQALDIYKTELGENHPNYITSLNNIAGCYNDIGDYTLAIGYYSQALFNLSKTYGTNNLDYALYLNNLSACYANKGDFTLAIEGHQEAIKIRKQILGENHPAYAQSISNLADCYYHFGRYDTAIKLNELATKIRKETLGEMHPDYALSLHNLAAYYEKVDLDMAIKICKRAIEVRCDMFGKNNYDYAASLGNLAFIYYKANKYANITPIWFQRILTLKNNVSIQFREMTSAQRQIYWNNNILSSIVKSNNLYAKVLSDDKQSMGISYNSLLFSKGVILASDIEFDKVIRESGDTVLLEKFEELRTTRAILNTYYNKPIAERPEGEVERLEARAEVLEKDLLAGSKEYADFTRRLEIEWEDVQDALGDKDVAIEILAADEHIDEDTPPYYAALVLRKGWDAPKFVELCGAEELQAYFDSENGLAMMYREANSRKLYDLIWGKLAEHINEGDNVYFSPGGLLHQVNVELLQDADGRLANDKYNLHRVSSTRELCFEKPKIAHSEAVLYGGLMYDMDSTAMVAQSRAVRPEEEHYAMRGLQLDSLRGKLNYLSASKTEVEKISKQMSQHGIKTTLYVEQVGNEESFKALSGKKTPIIHIATHGFFFKNEEAKVKPFFRMMSMDQERPRPDNSLRRSGLAFAGAQKAWDGEEIPKGIDDGVMLAQEIASMDLAGTDLVALSACETGLGEINSEGVFGLQRAFKKAGVQTLVMSLWKVHDEATALFMQTFYGNLLSGKSKRDSFAAAQMALREHRDYGKDPYYWAGFIMLD